MHASLLEIGVIGLDFLVLAALMGGAAVGGWLTAGLGERGLVADGLRGLVDATLAVLMMTTVLMLGFRTANLVDVPFLQAWPYALKVITHSHFGTLWLVRAVALLVLVMLWIWVRRNFNARAYACFVLAGAIMATAISSTTHAGSEGIWTFDNMVNSLHILAACFWGGTVIAYIIVMQPLFKNSREMRSAIAVSTVRFSTLAGGALAIVVVTGLINAWHRLDSWQILWTTGYGWTLSAKLALVALMAGIGALNRFLIVPSIESPAVAGSAVGTDPARRFFRVLRVDSLVFLLIMLLAAALSMQSPRHEGGEGMHGATADGYGQSLFRNGMVFSTAYSANFYSRFG